MSITNEISGKAALLEVRGATRRGESGRLLLDSVSLAVAAGERLAIAGPSGAGKTLLLRAMALLDPRDEGAILWRGQTVQGQSVPSYRARVSYLHQKATLVEGTVEDNLRLPFSLQAHRGKSFDRERIVAWLAELGRVESFLGQRHDDLSGGEAQLAAILRAIQLGGDALLLDEPVSALDDSTRQAAEALIACWHAELPGQRATVWITHDRVQAGRVAERLLVMEGGKLRSE